MDSTTPDYLTTDMTTTINSTNSTNDSYDDYDYEIETTVPLEQLLPVSFIFSLTLLLGLLGNSLVIFSITYYRRMRTVTNVLLLSLASADILLVLICVPIKAVAFLTFSWEFGEELCKVVHYMQNYTMICSVLTLTVISLERLVVVLFPLEAKSLCTIRHAIFIILGVWILSGLLALPTVFIYVHLAVGYRYPAFWCIKDYLAESDAWIKAFEVYMTAILFILPLCVMIFAYSIIGSRVWDVGEIRASGRVATSSSDGRKRSLTKEKGGERALLGTNGNSSSSNGAAMQSTRPSTNRLATDERETRKQVVAMLVMVVVLFAMCWGPILINNLLTAWGYLHWLHHGYLKPMRQAFLILSYVNSCLNPVVYAFFSRNFRTSFKMAICACVKGKAFVRAYRYSISAASTRFYAQPSNGRAMSTAYETGTSTSENDMTRSPTSNSPQSMELQKV